MKTYSTKIKNGVMLLFLLVGICSCQKEELIHKDPINASVTNRVSVKDVPILQEFVTNKMKGLPQKSLGNSTYVETPFGQIPLENITEVIDNSGNRNYTFKIYPNNPEPHTFYNLIVNPSANDDDLVSFVLEYKMEEKFATDYLFGEKLISEFQGEINKYSVDTFLNKSITKSADLPCPCSEIDISDNSNNLGGPGGGSSGGFDDSNPDDSGSGTGGNGGSSGSSSGGGGGCSVHVVVDCVEQRGIPRWGFSGGWVCFPVATIVNCTSNKSLQKTADDCPVNDEGDCPNNNGEFGVNDYELVDFLNITERQVRMALLFNPNNDLAQEIGDFLWRFKDSEVGLNTAKEISKDLAEIFVAGEMDKEYIKFILQSNTEEEVIIEMSKAIKAFKGETDISSLDTKLANAFFVNFTGGNLTSIAADFSEFGEAWLPHNIDPDDVLTLQDWLLVSGKALLVKNLALGYPLANEQTRNEILKEIGVHSATVSLTAPLKSLVGEYWPQTDEEWNAIGEIAAPLLLEIGLAAIPGSDIIDVVKGIAANDYWLVAAAIAGLTVDLFGATIVKVIAKFGKAIYKAFKIVKAVGNFLAEVGQIISRGFNVVYENSVAVLKDASGRIISQGDDVGRISDVLSEFTDTTALERVTKYLANDIDIVKQGDKLIALTKNGDEIGEVLSNGLVKGKFSGRTFDPSKAGGTIIKSDWKDAVFNSSNINDVKRHLARLDQSAWNDAMIERLERIKNGQISATDYDKRFITHENREFERFRNLGYENQNINNIPDDVWENTHSATLEDYSIRDYVIKPDGSRDYLLYHPDVQQIPD